ncbi:RNA 2',3'-cyclic phosphodiesterase [Rhodobacteraceae bacterium D3-12]|nr:RNA 2',3'-cyclic phosphodiesterase [Rhodobacteraceae bacterium D3-12]
MRGFVALGLSEGMLDALEVLQEGMPGRVVPRAYLHLTLAFLGEVSGTVVERVHEGLEGVRLEAPRLRVTGVDMLSGRKPRLCFAAVEVTPELVALRYAVRGACRGAGVDLARERFRPHVTLSRFGREIGPRDAAVLAGRLGVVSIAEARAAGLGLYRSLLRPEGPRYDMLAGYDFD